METRIDIIPSKQTAIGDFECPHYAPFEGEKRCRHFLKNGACDRPDQVMCFEWLKRNRPETEDKRRVAKKKPEFQLQIQETNQRPISQFAVSAEGAAVSAQLSVSASDTCLPVSGRQGPPLGVQSPAFGLQPDQIASFKKLGMEVCFHSDTFGEVWLVPKYTAQARREITPEHAATICQVLSVFPGSRVTAFEKVLTKEKEAPV
jgi:hypothetical protein